MSFKRFLSSSAHVGGTRETSENRPQNSGSTTSVFTARPDGQAVPMEKPQGARCPNGSKRGSPPAIYGFCASLERPSNAGEISFRRRKRVFRAGHPSPTGEVAGRCSSDEAAENRNYLIDPFEYSSNERFHEIAPLHVLLRDSTAHPFCREIIRATGGNWVSQSTISYKSLFQPRCANVKGLDNVSSATLRPFNSDINTPRIDSYRFSMANLEGKKPVGGDVTIASIDPAVRR
uniref:Uncharacterized protein n=1 Tax=Vespula pensylvanica TaxID=30213 RepID=A0A834JT73_VESPE|nr:hypothetical protein H0235_016774 [Vespula pensylvanica]